MKAGQWRTGKRFCGQMKGCMYTWKEKGTPLSDRTTTPTVKHGGGNNLIIWGCMAWNRVGKLTEVEGKMDAVQYCEILEDGVVENFEKLEVEEEEKIFRQDNDHKYTSKKATKWFEDNNIQVFPWPAQSPDLNPVEHLWLHLKKRLREYPTPPMGVHELKVFTLPNEYYQSPIRLVPPPKFL